MFFLKKKKLVCPFGRHLVDMLSVSNIIKEIQLNRIRGMSKLNLGNILHSADFQARGRQVQLPGG